ncbi:MAG: hypothetical protein JXQ90_11945 [Cyclobacteriaceae bacterium]
MNNQKLAHKSVQWRSINHTEHLQFTFPSTFTVDDAVNFIEQSGSLLNYKEDVIMIWDCSQMRRYQPGSRELWQGFIKEHQSKISKIWLVSDSVMIRGGAKLIALFTSLDIVTVTSLDMIEETSYLVSSRADTVGVQN